MNKYLRYLPSRKFVLIISIVIILAIIIFVIFFMSSSEENFTTTGNNKQNTVLKVKNETLSDLIKKDSDGDGVPDWEENLWGTDKNKKITFNNIPDATYIANKKKELKIKQSVNTKKLTETEKFAREFFTSYNALKSSGQIDKNTINNFSSALGQKIVNPNLIDRYKEADIKINSNDNSTTRQRYYQKVKKLFKSYQSIGMGDELAIVTNKLLSQSADKTNNKINQNSKLLNIANAYQDFAKKIMKIDVPQSLTQYHLQIANDSNNTGLSVLNMGKVVKDPIVGLSGLSQYRKYSDNLVKAVSDLETFLSK